MAKSRRRSVLWSALVAVGLFTAWTQVWPTYGDQIVLWINDFPSRSAVFRGHYSSGFEESAFQPCGSTELWWVDVEEKSGPRVSRAMERHDRRSYVEWHGTRTGKGQYGHLGQYSRNLKVTEVITIKPPRPGDCK